MFIKHEPFIFILSSPSGAGKTTIARAILESDKNIEMSISCTTRPKRKGEIDGKDYHFLTEDEFEKFVEDKKLLEYARVYGKSYGTPKDRVEKLLASNKDVLFDVDWQGTNQLKSIIPEQIVSVFILPPSMEELETRLRSRGSDDEENIQNRLAQAKIEISHWDSYDYVIVNKQIEESLRFVKAILDVERLKRANTWKIADELLSYEIK